MRVQPIIHLHSGIRTFSMACAACLGWLAALHNAANIQRIFDEFKPRPGVGQPAATSKSVRASWRLTSNGIATGAWSTLGRRGGRGSSGGTTDPRPARSGSPAVASGTSSAQSRRRMAQVSGSGCSYDSSGAGPWARPIQGTQGKELLIIGPVESRTCWKSSVLPARRARDRGLRPLDLRP